MSEVKGELFRGPIVGIHDIQKNIVPVHANRVPKLYGNVAIAKPFSRRCAAGQREVTDEHRGASDFLKNRVGDNRGSKNSSSVLIYLRTVCVQYIKICNGRFQCLAD